MKTKLKMLSTGVLIKFCFNLFSKLNFLTLNFTIGTNSVEQVNLYGTCCCFHIFHLIFIDLALFAK